MMNSAPAQLASYCREELAVHYVTAIQYFTALSWTHVFLPFLGGPTLVSIPELTVHGFHGFWFVFVWLWTLAITGACFWWFDFAHAQALAMEHEASAVPRSLPRTILIQCFSTSSKSMAWVAAWAWMVAALGSLPTGGPLDFLLSASLFTVAAAAALFFGQRGRGPWAKALRSRDSEQVKWMIFFASWMTAVVWCGALMACVDALGLSPLPASWIVALGGLAARRAWLKARDAMSNRGPSTPGGHATAAAAAYEVYAASPAMGLGVGLVEASETSDDAAPGAPAVPAAPPKPFLNALLDATIGLCALAGAWLSCVALQLASSALWATKAWPTSGLAAVLADGIYAAALSTACVAAVAYLRATHMEEAAYAAVEEAHVTEALALRRAAGLAGETVALATACGWAWFNFAMVLFPPLASEYIVVRALAAVGVTAAAVLVLERLGPASGRPDSPAPGGAGPPTSPLPGAGAAMNHARYEPPRAALKV